MVDPLSLTVDACLAAVADAGLTLDDIDGLSTYPGAAAMGMSEGGVTAVEEALRLHPTWINGGGDLPGPGGSVIAAMLAVASGLCRHVLCFRTVWESTYAALGLHAGGGGGRVSGPMQEWRLPFGAMSAANWIGMNANQYLHRYGATREMLGWIALNGRANAARNPAAIYRDPMTMDDYLSARPITSPVRALRLRRPVRRVDRGDRVRRLGGRRPAQARGAGRGGRHPDHRAHLVGPGHHHPRAPGARPVGPPVDPHRPAPRRRRPGPPLRRLHLQRHLVARGARASAASARPRTGSTAAGASPSTATCRSTPTAASCPRAAPTASASSTRRWPSCATRPASARSPAPGPRWSPPAAAPRRASSCSAAATPSDGRRQALDGAEEGVAGRRPAGRAPPSPGSARLRRTRTSARSGARDR